MEDIEDIEEELMTGFCEIHGAHHNEVCVPCYDIQAKRVEMESAELRYKMTTSSHRQEALAILAERNGH